ncbi:MAG: PRTRC system ThiF family protein [Ignavibacteriae bacterium]|nr:PRTRC system ThiF family protein [Ignavibacteriota bacterium]
MIHFPHEYLKNPTHRITVALIGAGGTGSQVLNGIARMDIALRKLGHKGLYVKCYDDDIVSESNIGRQLFIESEIGKQKSQALINRINRFFALDWDYTGKYEMESDMYKPNIYISCVDNVKTRKDIASIKFPKQNNMSQTPIYWLDYGNSKNVGQVVLGTMREINQRYLYTKIIEYQKSVKRLKNVCQLFTDMKDDEDNTPSCSLAEALEKQDLYINSTLANLGLALLWKLFREEYISFHGAFLNLQNFKVNPIKI